MISNAKAYATRLMPGVDLKQSIIAIAKKEKFTGACIVSAVGSLWTACLRLPQKDGTLISKTWKGHFEITSLIGTVSEAGKHAHLHLSFSDGKGRVVGGHVLDGCMVRTTVELMMTTFDNLSFDLKRDTKTGFDELYTKKLFSNS